MNTLIVSIPILLGTVVTSIFIPIWIRRAHTAGLVGSDMQKPSRPQVAEAGGVAVLLGFVLSILIYIQINAFCYQSCANMPEMFALLSTIVIVGFVGFMDDILGWKIGLRRRARLFLVVIATIPLVVITAQDSAIMGLQLGLLYPLVIVPVGIVGSTTTFNFLAGYNGLEASQGIVILSAIGITLWLTGSPWLGIVAMVMVCCLASFYLYNRYPASVFPGDVLTYSVGALIAVLAILGNIEEIVMFFFIPYVMETVLKVRGGLKKESFGKVNADGSLDMPYSKFYGLEHIAIYLLKKWRRRACERSVVRMINAFQVLVILLGFTLFHDIFRPPEGIFPLSPRMATASGLLRPAQPQYNTETQAALGETISP